MVGVAVVPDVVNAGSGDVGVVRHIRDLGSERNRVVHFDDVGRAFRFDHDLGDDATKLRYLRRRRRRNSRVNEGVVRTAGWCLRQEVKVNHKFVSVRWKVGRHDDGDVKGTRGVVQGGLCNVYGPLFGEQRDRDQGRVVDHRGEVDRVEHVTKEAG